MAEFVVSWLVVAVLSVLAVGLVLTIFLVAIKKGAREGRITLRFARVVEADLSWKSPKANQQKRRKAQ